MSCVCCSGKAFSQCCGLYLNQGQRPKTSVVLMRSRYAAFALGGYGDYLLKTWHPDSVADLSAIELSIKSVNWSGLEILAKSQAGNRGMVEFKAHFLAADGSAEVHHEKSDFQRVDGQWFYLGPVNRPRMEKFQAK